MTRKQALLGILELLETTQLIAQITANEKEDLITKTQEIIAELPIASWSEATIHDTIQQWAIDHGRNPTATDFKYKGLPPHPVIKNRFGITLKAFLEKHYPTARKCKSNVFGHKSKEEWRDIFIEEFNRIKPLSSVEYNERKSKGTPTWISISRMFNIRSWYSWLAYTGQSRFYKNTADVKKPELCGDIIDLFNEIEECEKQSDEFIKENVYMFTQEFINNRAKSRGWDTIPQKDIFNRELN